MTIKKIIITLLCCIEFNNHSWAQYPGLRTMDDIIYDVDNQPVYSMRYTEGKDRYCYLSINGFASYDIEFIGGGEKYKEVTDSLYNIHQGKLDIHIMNCRPAYFVLFDENLKILDVRILERRYSFPEEKRLRYDKLVKWIVRSTEGHWRKINPQRKCKYYFMIGRLHFTEGGLS